MQLCFELIKKIMLEFSRPNSELLNINLKISIYNHTGHKNNEKFFEIFEKWVLLNFPKLC